MVTGKPQHSEDRTSRRFRPHSQQKPAWAKRLQMAERLAREIRSGNVAPNLALARQLSADPKWEVRKQVAQVLEQLPEDVARELGAALQADANAYVSEAAKRALERRDAAAEKLRGQKDAALLLGQYSRVQTLHGKTAARQAHAMARTRFRKLVQSLAHDLTNIMSSMAATESLASVLAREGHKLAPAAANVHKTKLLLQSYLEQLTSYARGIGTTRHPVRLLPIVLQAQEIAQRALKEQGFDLAAVDITTNVPAEAVALLNQQAFTVALANIIKNAYEAHSRDGGLILHPGGVTIAVQTEDNIIRLTVSDKGRGIPEQELNNLRTFIPGQKSTSKPFSSGFGLPTAFEIIQAHEGELEIISKAGSGTTVTITLPRPAKDK